MKSHAVIFFVGLEILQSSGFSGILAGNAFVSRALEFLWNCQRLLKEPPEDDLLPSCDGVKVFQDGVEGIAGWN